MDATAVARRLLEPIPANQLFGLRILRAADASAEVCMQVTPELTNVIGSLHSSGLIALVDATGLAAVIAAIRDENEFDEVTPLGAEARLEFLAPARGRLVGRCTLEPAELAALRRVLDGEHARATLATAVEIVDADPSLVCRGSFDWKLRRQPT